MTTCIWDGALLAADTRQTMAGGGTESCRKIHELPDGTYLADSGHSEPCEKMRLWLSGLGDKPTFGEDDDFRVLHILGPNEAVTYDNSTVPIEALPPVALGSGSKAGLALVKCAGMTAIEAVTAMIKNEIDIYTGGAVDFVDTTTIVRKVKPPVPKKWTYKRRRKSTN